MITIISKFEIDFKLESEHSQYLDLCQKYNDKANQYDLAEKDMYDIASLLIKLNTPIDMDFEAKYQLSTNNVQRRNEDTLREELTTFRLQTSREEQIKAYYIFNNAEMDDMIAKYPRTENELLEVKGFGKVKVGKYGSAILNIFNG
ncbi:MULTISPECIES: HRDC domain-containing protein [unclassified Paenibacillus]|uniref:HRDC domain-containing protein n=1 Tax=unclassified Paenibacillus TaxID=185978 RepID=UPI002785FAB5|nr:MULTISPECIES: HRDC domain-containing protein [unclassified Paenibacillus]MDQ0902336.1 superfamily II DNA helicase RecQ [Paenibacillus sp. V4I7]MDQ0919170.1 superfamily II DNA helicase RecQ [Paenibacillus sp. V4I5]